MVENTHLDGDAVVRRRQLLSAQSVGERAQQRHERRAQRVDVAVELHDHAVQRLSQHLLRLCSSKRRHIIPRVAKLKLIIAEIIVNNHMVI